MNLEPLLLHGDCLAEMSSIEPGSVDLVLTDLPYGTTQNKWDQVIPMDRLWAAWKRILKPRAPIVLFTQQPFTTVVAASNLRQLKTEWIWEKGQGTGFLNARRYPLKIHENVLVFCEALPTYFPQMAMKVRGGGAFWKAFLLPVKCSRQTTASTSARATGRTRGAGSRPPFAGTMPIVAQVSVDYTQPRSPSASSSTSSRRTPNLVRSSLTAAWAPAAPA